MPAMAEVPAGFWKRYAAWTLDAAILALPVWLLSAGRMRAQLRMLHEAAASLFDTVAQRMVDALLRGVEPLALAYRLAGDAGVREALHVVALGVFALLIVPAAWFALLAAAYWIGFEASPWQATPGKRALGLRTTGLEGEKLHGSLTVARHFAGTLSWLTLNIGHAMAARAPQKRALHDLIAGARVSAQDDDPMPPAAKLWLALQAIAGLIAFGWLYLVLLGMMQASVDRALSMTL